MRQAGLFARAEGSSGLRPQGPEGAEGDFALDRLELTVQRSASLSSLTLKHLLSGNNCD